MLTTELLYVEKFVTQFATPREFFASLSRITTIPIVAAEARELAKDNLDLMEEACAV